MNPLLTYSLTVTIILQPILRVALEPWVPYSEPYGSNLSWSICCYQTFNSCPVIFFKTSGSSSSLWTTNCKWRILNLVYLEIRAASKTNRKAKSGNKTKKNWCRNYLITKNGLRDFPAQVSLSWSFPIADKPKISVFSEDKVHFNNFFSVLRSALSHRGSH